MTGRSGVEVHMGGNRWARGNKPPFFATLNPPRKVVPKTPYTPEDTGRARHTPPVHTSVSVSMMQTQSNRLSMNSNSSSDFGSSFRYAEIPLSSTNMPSSSPAFFRTSELR